MFFMHVVLWNTCNSKCYYDKLYVIHITTCGAVTLRRMGQIKPVERAQAFVSIPEWQDIEMALYNCAYTLL